MGQQTRDYVFVKDVARANFAAATRELPAPDGSMRAHSTSAPVSRRRSSSSRRRCRRAPGSSVPIEHSRRRARVSSSDLLVSIDKARALLGWEPKVDARTKASGETFAFVRASAVGR